MNLKLVSFAVCPYVQRAAITLNFKKQKFEIEYIDLANKPEWFLKLSPLGKVPILIVNETDVLFESAVINEYLDETVGEKTLSSDPLEKAKERAWIEYSSSLLMDLFGILNSPKPTTSLDTFFNKLQKLENVISDSGFFKKDVSIIDSSYAPIFFRMQFFDLLWNEKRFQNTKVKKWAENLVAQDYVKNSVRESFKDDFANYIKLKNQAMYGLMRVTAK
jgi:glutathione S-transferase